MNDRIKMVITTAEDYIHEYAQNGYSESGLRRLIAVLEKDSVQDGDFNGCDLFGIFKAFDCDLFERASLLIGLCAAVSKSSATALSKMGGQPSGSVTPGLLCNMLFGTDSISEYAGYFLNESVLSCFFCGVEPVYNAVMRVRDMICGYAFGEAFSEHNYIRPLKKEKPSDYMPLSYENAVEKITQGLLMIGGEAPLVINVSGLSGSGRGNALALATEKTSMGFAVIDLPFQAAINADFLKALCTELVILGLYPVVTGFNSARQDDSRLVSYLADELGFAAVISEMPIDSDSIKADVFTVEIPPLSLEEQRSIWLSESSSYDICDEIDFGEIAGEFCLTRGGVRKALRYSSICAGGLSVTEEHIKKGCYMSINSSMGKKAVKINSVFKWEDLVLPDKTKARLKAVCDQVRYRYTVYDKWNFGGGLPYGRGVSVIFTGRPGTGKTMAAQVLAGELGLEIYKVNLAAVVSKYIGDTEKNLEEIFDRAKKSRVILFFDEADVLFSKRTEVKDSNDKYSNMEAAFLLQKLEEYDGTAILATNYVQNFDEAFKRRMKFLIEFPFPEKKERRIIWEKVFPPKVPLCEIDYDYLVDNFELSGSNIKNIALHSAFLAAASNEPVCMKHIVAAVKNEFEKSGKAFTRVEAGEYSDYLPVNEE